MRLTFADAQRNVTEIANREKYNIDVAYELLLAYGRAASAVTKLRSGVNNLASDKDNEVLQRGVIYFKHVPDSGKLHSTIDELQQDPLVVRYNPRYLIVTDYDQMLAVDAKKGTTLDIKIRDIDRNVDFFYGWTGDEITDEKTEAVADRRAADKMRDLYAEIERINRDKLADPSLNFRHDLNVFFSRLLFCFFAEDTRVFSRTEEHMFTNAIKDFTQTDGSDLDQFLQTLFDAFDTEDKSDFTSPFSKFPYVNGTIFDTKKHNIGIPKFNAQARKYILDCGGQNWAEINPDIFGSMFQSIVDEKQRSSHGQHYTSVPNIMKTIDPLFLDGLREEFDKYYDNDQRLLRLWDRISKIKVFDPACGSGNFLIIAYKELRKVEHAIIERLFGDEHKRNQLAGRLESKIKLDNYYGIEIDDFPHEIAILSLYLAKHQMNIDFEQQFGKEIKLIPLKDNANIIHGDSTKLDWNDVCPNIPHKIGIKTGPEQSALIEFDDEQPELELGQQTWDEIYLIGNPPYLGSSMQDADQKASMARVFKNFSNYKNLDFIAAWFKIGADYIEGTEAQLAFVSTNSICQGEQVALLWSYILEKNVEIKFAYTSFKWTNNAKNNAGVTCVVVGLASVTNKKISKKLFSEGIAYEVENINPYLANGKNIIIPRRPKPISNLPEMIYGNKPSDGGFLILSKEEKEKLISQYPAAEKFIKRYMGADELLKDIYRYCIWVEDNELAEARSIPGIDERLNEVTEFRNSSKAKSTSDYSIYPNRFKQRTYRPENSLIVPSVTSERRKYQTLDFVGSDVVTSNRAFSIFGADEYLLGVLSSTMHNVWVNSVAGRLESRINYSSTICYNNFPLPYLYDHQKNEIAQCAREVIFARQNHSEKTIAEMYDPDKMPSDLREAHRDLDLTVDRLYRTKPYNNDEERLADLFELYEQMTEKEKVG